MEWIDLSAAMSFMPHGHCYLWRPDVLWMHVGSDAVIALSYYSIPIALVVVARRRPDFNLGWVLTAFGAFILLCGTTHVMEIFTVWRPAYYEEGFVKITTAAVSLATAVMLWPFVPKALAIPSPAQLESQNRRMALEVRHRERAEHDLRRSNEDLEQFAYIVSHDLSEPLRMVASYLQLLERKYGERLEGDASKYMGYAVDGAQRMQAMLQDLLDYSRVGRTEIGKQPVDLGQVMASVAQDLEGPIQETGAEIRVGPLPTVQGSEALLSQLFQNLIANSLKYRGEARPEVDIASSPEDGGHTITVADNGIGMDPKHAERIFLPFQRLHTRSKYPGTGIGLAVAKRVVDRHGGRIWVEATPGRGSRFHVHLPA